MDPKVNVQMVFDIPCVWSYFTYARLQRALAHFRSGGGRAELTFRPYQLVPDATVEGRLNVDVLRHAFGDDAEHSIGRIAALASDEGLTFHPERAVHSNTFHAHRLIAVASAQGCGEDMAERLFRAHHTDQLNLADLDTLKTLAAEIGVGWSDEGIARTREALESTRRLGVHGIPILQFEDRPALTGTPSEDSLLAALHSAVGRRRVAPRFTTTDRRPS
ncbi:DsbA family oxidoreductase [Streptosporangium sp. NBC_01469]|uniref:DsbA family oxidoreductase n=1 Tax=Streptosporangium sp. NBC_01469 TaxID=2903898 RepID=UPI002E2AF40E|nr:DsbA family protein [Streptosporangium sp. NBC_01469]